MEELARKKEAKQKQRGDEKDVELRSYFVAAAAEAGAAGEEVALAEEAEEGAAADLGFSTFRSSGMYESSSGPFHSTFFAFSSQVRMRSIALWSG